MYLRSMTDTIPPRAMFAENIPATICRVAGIKSNITRRKRNTMNTLAVEEVIHRYWIWGSKFLVEGLFESSYVL